MFAWICEVINVADLCAERCCRSSSTLRIKSLQSGLLYIAVFLLTFHLIVMVRATLIVLVVAVVLHSCAQRPPCDDPNKIRTDCVGCPRRCGMRRPPPCGVICEEGCACRDGYYMRNDGRCVLWKDC